MNVRALFLSFPILLSLLAVSCSPVKTTIAPVINPAGELVVMKPSAFALNNNTKDSKVMALIEDTMEPMSEEWLESHFGLSTEAEKPEGIAVVLVLGVGTVWEKGQSAPSDAIVPMLVAKHVGVEQEQVDLGMKKVQRIVYRELNKRGRMIPQRLLRDDIQTQRVTQ